MSATPRWKVYNTLGEYVAACKYAEDAAAVATNYGSGATIRDGHKRIVYTVSENDDGSYDRIAAEVYA